MAPTVTVTATAESGAGRVSSRVAVTRTVCAPPSSPTEVRAASEESVKVRLMDESSSMMSKAASTSGNVEPPNVTSSPCNRMVSVVPSATLSSFTTTVIATCLEVPPAGMSNPKSWSAGGLVSVGRVSRKSSPDSHTASELRVAEPPSTLTPTSTPEPAGAVVPEGSSAFTHTLVEPEFSARLVTGSPLLSTQDSRTPVSTMSRVSSTEASVPSTVAVPVTFTSSAPSSELSSHAVRPKVAEPWMLRRGMLNVNLSPVWSVSKSPVGGGPADPKVASPVPPSPAIVTDTSVGSERVDSVTPPAKRATTEMVCSPDPSTTVPGVAVISKAVSASSTVRSSSAS